MMSNANNRQVGGRHYASNVQHWDFAAAHFGRGYFKGQITKYVSRWRKKNGVQDLQKALHFLEKLMEIEQRDSDCVSGWWARLLCYMLRLTRRAPEPSLDTYLRANFMTSDEAVIIGCVTGGSLVELRVASGRLRAIILKAMATQHEFAEADASRAYVNQDPNHGG
jgi:hypothetical protein